MKKIRFIIILLVFCVFMETTAFAYIYFSRGYISATMYVECSTSWRTPFNNSISAWTSTSTPAYIIESTNSDNWVIETSENDTWLGMYEASGYFGRTDQFNIYLNRYNLSTKSNNYIQSVLVHEFGHALCLDDNPSSGNKSIMNYDRNRSTCIIPQLDDINGVNYAYNGY